MRRKLLISILFSLSTSVLADGTNSSTTDNLPFKSFVCASGYNLKVFSPNTQSIYLKYHARTFHLMMINRLNSSSVTYTDGLWSWRQNLREGTALLLNQKKILERCPVNYRE